MATLRGINRGLWRAFTAQGAQEPIQSDLNTPIQAVQLVDDVSNVVNPVRTPNGFTYGQIIVAPASGSDRNGMEIRSGPGGLLLYLDPVVSLHVWSDENRPPLIVPSTTIFNVTSTTEFTGLGVGFTVDLIEVPAGGLALLPLLTRPTAFLPDWFYLPPSRLFGVATELHVIIQQTIQFKEYLGE